MIIRAGEIKKRGVKAFDEALSNADEVVINIRGRDRYVVMDIERYKELRRKELDIAYMEVMDDIKNGRYHTDVEKHIKEIENV